MRHLSWGDGFKPYQPQGLPHKDVELLTLGVLGAQSLKDFGLRALRLKRDPRATKLVPGSRPVAKKVGFLGEPLIQGRVWMSLVVFAGSSYVIQVMCLPYAQVVFVDGAPFGYCKDLSGFEGRNSCMYSSPL